jgi:phosphotransferase system enzyme I (PtsI)
MPKKSAKKEGVIGSGLLRGIPVSEGIAIGKVYVLESSWDEVIPVQLKKNSVKKEVARYNDALVEVSRQLEECRDRVRNEIGEEEAGIFKAHLVILKDSFFTEKLTHTIRLEKMNAEYVLKVELENLEKTFSMMKNEHFRDRLDDIRDVGVRILRVLIQSEEVKFSPDEAVVLMAHRLTPSDTARFDQDKILGFATELGGKTSHASILARSMGLPAVVGVDRLIKKACKGIMAIVDGNAGIIYIDPPGQVLEGYRKRKKQYTAYWKRLSEEAGLPAITADGVEISIQANIAITADISLAVKYHARGIGLFRTELPFLLAGHLLSEEEQLNIYQTVIHAMKGQPVTIRTLDLGGDKFLPFQEVANERNPFLGWRSIRIFLQEKDIFKTQLRALFRASKKGPVKLLFPMISSLGEIHEIRQVVDETIDELKRDGVEFDEQIPLGVMVEVPSVAILADRLIHHVDFFSIGTNDLIQYTLAVDRNNEKVAKFYQPLNPAILQLIHHTIKSGESADKPVSLCGEMAGNPLYTALLLGLGLKQFSMSPLMIPEVKERIRAVTMKECEELAAGVMQMTDTEKIEEKLWAFHKAANKKQSIPYLEKDRSVPESRDNRS